MTIERELDLHFTRRQLFGLTARGIGGAALGSMLIGTPLPVLKQLSGQCLKLFGKTPSREDYCDLLAMLYQLFKAVVVEADGANQINQLDL